ncbi:MAG: DUF2852 domain-containing protein [Proteobacteria bacterium]|nr:DUF2852 domain-containing protein [Pseudomonadota bacterium]
MLHLLFLPFFIVFHIAGFVLLLVAAAILSKVFCWRRAIACMARQSQPRTSGESENSAFDEYRRATLKQLEGEAEEFRKYLDGLRRAADSAAFEAFLKTRRAGGSAT